MLHKNVIENKGGFRELTKEGVTLVSGGDGITVTGDPFVNSIRPEDLAAVGETFASAFGTLPINVPVSGNEIVVEGERGSDDDYDSSTFLPIFPFVFDTDTDDFKEFLVEDQEFTAQQAENEIIVEANIGNQEIIVHFNGDGDGAIYIVHDNTFSDDDFVLFTEIKNAFFSVSQSQETSINEGGGSISIGNGVAITFERVGPNG